MRRLRYCAIAAIALGIAIWLLFGSTLSRIQRDRRIVSAVRAKDAGALAAALHAGGNPNALYAPLGERQGVIDYLPARFRRDYGPAVENGTPILLVAVLNGDFTCARLLLEHGANPDPLDEGHITALSYAAEVGRSDLCKLLLAHGASVSTRDLSDNTALHSAALARDPACVDAILRAGADPNAQNASLETPLLRAVKAGNKAAYLPLIAGGSDPDIRDVSGTSARALAKKNSDAAALTAMSHVAAQPRKQEKDNTKYEAARSSH